MADAEKDNDKRIKELEDKVKNEPNNASEWNELSVCYDRAGNNEKSIEASKKAVEIEPERASYVENLAISYRKNKQYSLAIQYGERAVEIEPNNTLYFINLAFCYNKNNQLDLAIHYGKKAVEIEPDNASYLNNLAFYYCENNQLDLAIQYGEKAVKIKPNNALYLNNLAFYYNKNSQLNLAIQHDEAAVKIEPDNAIYLKNLCVYYEKNKQYDEAAEYCKKAMALEPKDSKEDILDMLDRMVDRSDVDHLLAVVKDHTGYLTGTQYEFLANIISSFSDNPDLQKQLVQIQIDVKKIEFQLSWHLKDCELGQYTKFETAFHLLGDPKEPDGKENENKKLRLYNSQYMNDPAEGSIFIEYLNNHFKGRQTALQKLVIDNLHNLCDINNSDYSVYFSCFTSDHDNLPMFTQYGAQCAGCCIVFSDDFFDELSKKMEDTFNVHEISEPSDKEGSEISPDIQNKRPEKYIPYRVIYIDDKDKSDLKIADTEVEKEIFDICKIIDRISRLCADDSLKKKSAKFIADILNQIRFLFKSKSYEYEAEYRLIKYVPNNCSKIKQTKEEDEKNHIPHLYIEKDDGKPDAIEEIVLGPKVENANEIAPYIKHIDNRIKVKKSSIKFR